MDSRDRIKETRLLISQSVPFPSVSKNQIDGNSDGCLLRLSHPKSGNPTSYAFANGSIQEIHWFKQAYGSWFLGDHVCEDGGLYTSTPVDPVFILLPIFEEARMKKHNDQGKFRELEEIMFVNGYPGYQNLISNAEVSMQVVCEVKEVGSSKYFRLNDSKVLAWLCHKVDRLKLTLRTLDNNYAARNDKDTLTDVISLLGEYLKNDPWLNLLCNHLQLDIQETIQKAEASETINISSENSSGSFQAVQMKNGNEKSTSSQRRQPKRLKAETASLNIKDMFCKASKSKT